MQPLWITLALQKQKGFREQQATREEKKQAREAKQAEKLSKENVSSLRSSTLTLPSLSLALLDPKGFKKKKKKLAGSGGEYLGWSNKLSTVKPGKCFQLVILFSFLMLSG